MVAIVMIFELALNEKFEQANGKREKIKTVNDSTIKSEDFGKFLNISGRSFAELDERLNIFEMKSSRSDLR